MYKFYKDKNENFECNIGLEGASLSNAKARLVLENDEFNLIFKGSIDENGKCIVPIKKLKILTEGLAGKLKLEVIVDDDTYFLPFEDNFVVGVNKKLTVEVVSQSSQSTKKLTVEVSQLDVAKVVNELYSKLRAKKISLLNMQKFPKTINEIVSDTMLRYKPSKTQYQEIQNQLLLKLSKEREL